MLADCCLGVHLHSALHSFFVNSILWGSIQATGQLVLFAFYRLPQCQMSTTFLSYSLPFVSVGMHGPLTNLEVFRK